jgi:predicted transposase/invertase (TIGR01784 family)
VARRQRGTGGFGNARGSVGAVSGISYAEVAAKVRATARSFLSEGPHARYISLTTDFGFKRLFGEEAHVDLLRDFLNSLLPPDHQIAALRFRDKEDRSGGRDVVSIFFDILCETADGRHFIVEMQRASQRHFFDRAVYYVSSVIRAQEPHPDGRAASDAYALAPVFFIGVLDHEYDKPCAGASGYRRFKHRLLGRTGAIFDQNQERISDAANFIFVQLPLADLDNPAQRAEFGEHLLKWLCLLRDIEDFSDLPALFHEEVFARTAKIAEKANLSEKERFDYWRSLDAKISAEAAFDTAAEVARKEAKLETARKMKAKGFSPADIAELTGLTLDQVQAL